LAKLDIFGQNRVLSPENKTEIPLSVKYPIFAVKSPLTASHFRYIFWLYDASAVPKALPNVHGHLSHKLVGQELM